MVPWGEVDTVLLDMDGTLIDLHFDNHLWNVVVPARFGEREGMDSAQAAQGLYREMLASKASLDFYDLDYWARQRGWTSTPFTRSSRGSYAIDQGPRLSPPRCGAPAAPCSWPPTRTRAASP